MFIAIIIIAMVIGILFFVLAISLVVFIYSTVKKNGEAKKKCLQILIPSAAVWVVLIGVNIFLIITFLYKNKDEIIDQAVRIPAEMAGKGLALTFQSFEKNWDQNRIQQLQNLYISFSSMDFENKNGEKIYSIELIFDNNTPAEVKLYLDDLIGNHYLAACDSDDFAYSLQLVYTSIEIEKTTEMTSNGTTEKTTQTSRQYSDTIIPFGKSRYRFNITVPEDVEITHVRFLNNTIPLK
jgi:energy-coupling factor transporter transmembrane protein EcfT